MSGFVGRDSTLLSKLNEQYRSENMLLKFKRLGRFDIVHYDSRFKVLGTTHKTPVNTK